MEKKLVCQADGRQFKTQAALAQHRKDAHGKGQKGPAKQRAPKVGRQTAGGAPVSSRESVRGVQTDLSRLAGLDRIFHGTISSRLSSGTIVCDLLITPGMFKRLAVVARAYQKIRYLRLNFRVEPQMSTATSGGYVVAFVRDPADNVRNIDILTSQQGSMTTKWWQSSTVPVPALKRDFYTSDSVEIREYSPGRLVLMVDGPATQIGSVTVFAEWSVELSQPSLEEPSTVSTNFVLVRDMYARSGHVGMFARMPDGSYSGEIKDMITGAQVGDYFRPDRVAMYPSPTAGQFNGLSWLYVKTNDDLIPCYGLRSEQDTAGLSQTAFVLPSGTVLEKYVPPSTLGEETRPSSSDLLKTTADFSPMLEALSRFLSDSFRLAEKSATCSSDYQGQEVE